MDNRCFSRISISSAIVGVTVLSIPSNDGPSDCTKKCGPLAHSTLSPSQDFSCMYCGLCSYHYSTQRRFFSLLNAGLNQWPHRAALVSYGRVIGPSQRLLYLTHNNLRTQTSMLPAGFEPSFPTSDRPQTHALVRAATGKISSPYSG